MVTPRAIPRQENRNGRISRTAWRAPRLLATVFAERAPVHDRDGSFPFRNFDDLSEAGLFALTVPAALGGGGVVGQASPESVDVSGVSNPMPKWRSLGNRIYSSVPPSASENPSRL